MKSEGSKLDKQYELYKLDKSDLDPDPIIQFKTWFDQAVNAGIIFPNAMTLATSGKNSIPSARMMLLKSYDKKGFVFYTNSNSGKGAEILENPYGAICFWWDKLQKQVRIEGVISLISQDEAETYFKTRPRGSRIGTWCSDQSKVIGSRKELEDEFSKNDKKYEGMEIPKPEYWNGYNLNPHSIEFWQGREDRLHDRLIYRLDQTGNWKIERSAP